MRLFASTAASRKNCTVILPKMSGLAFLRFSRQRGLRRLHWAQWSNYQTNPESNKSPAINNLRGIGISTPPADPNRCTNTAQMHKLAQCTTGDWLRFVNQPHGRIRGLPIDGRRTQSALHKLAQRKGDW